VFFYQINNDCNTLTPFKYLECHKALGMENRAISDEQISASSEWAANHAAIQGRLHFQAGDGKTGAWSAKTNDAHQWLQIDLSSLHVTVTRVATQGRNGCQCKQWVTKYKLQYSNDTLTYQYYRRQGQTADKVKYKYIAKVRNFCTEIYWKYVTLILQHVFF